LIALCRDSEDPLGSEPATLSLRLSEANARPVGR
jgi:hypothetical protein